MDYNPMKALKEFHETFAPDQQEDTVFEKTQRRINLIVEESHEVIQALGAYRQIMGSDVPNGNAYETKAELAAELADLLYVVYGTAEELGIPLDKVFNEIHAANMRKVWDDGEVHRNDFGKIIKPPNFVKADVRKVLYGELDETEAS